MGTCCFAPTRQQFLWWYWLLLVSIVGIPMLLAVMYVAREKDADEQAKQARGKTAAVIFWVGTFLVSIALGFVVACLLRVLDLTQPTEAPWVRADELVEYWLVGYVYLAIQLFVAFVAANATNDLVRKLPWYGRMVVLVVCLFGYLVAISCVGLLNVRPAINVMQFMACMLPAHYWGAFKDSANPQTAWRALWAFLAGATLFFAVSYFGEPSAQIVVGAFK